MRTQPFTIYDPKTGEREDIVKPYYPRSIYSTLELATGNSLAAFKPFNNQEAQTLRNYTKGQNLFELNQGRLLYLYAEIYSTAFASFVAGEAGAATMTILDDYTKLYAQHELIIKQDGQDAHKLLFSELLPEPPWTVPALTSGGGSIIDHISAGGGFSMDSTRRGVYFTPPIFVGNGRTLDFAIATTSGYTVAAVLNGAKIRFVLGAEEIQPDSPSPVRA